MTVPEFTSFWQWLGWFLIVAVVCAGFVCRDNGKDNDKEAGSRE